MGRKREWKERLDGKGKVTPGGFLEDLEGGKKGTPITAHKSSSLLEKGKTRKKNVTRK